MAQRSCVARHVALAAWRHCGCSLGTGTVVRRLSALRRCARGSGGRGQAEARRGGAGPPFILGHRIYIVDIHLEADFFFPRSSVSVHVSGVCDRVHVIATWEEPITW